jgi:ribosomal protein S18 acetylase RimI-like enzyme/nitroimidazol reductase NimA-like FMN-containing flavoprotein (pyridoxamine 5'-phosphate oxidase superfamily)
MRRPEFTMTRAQALAFLQEAEVLHLAFTRPDGAPVLRTLNAAVTDDWLFFHGAPMGEKAQSFGRAVVVQAEQILATIPSYFSDPEKACPATTFFRSVQVHGTLEKITDPHLKAEALQRIMQRYQPEGGHVPIHFDNPLYQNAIRGVLVMGVRTTDLTGKAKLGQNKQPLEVQSIMAGLWRRGKTGDPRTIALMFAHHPETSRPELFRGPAGTWLWPTLGPADVNAAVDLLDGQYWTEGASREELTNAQLGATAWLGARDANGRLVATARANSDGARHAYIADVAVAPEYRGRGLGAALVKLLLDHPAVRGAGLVRLATKDAQPFYERFGFQPEEQIKFAFPVARLLLRRSVVPRDVEVVAHGAPQPALGRT